MLVSNFTRRITHLRRNLMVSQHQQRLMSSRQSSRKDLLGAIDAVLRSHGTVDGSSVGRLLKERLGTTETDLKARLRHFGGIYKLVRANAVPPSPRYTISGGESKFTLSLADKKAPGGGNNYSNNRHYGGVNSSASSTAKGDLTVSTINATMNTYAKSGDLKSCLTWFKLINELGMKPDAYSMSILIRAHCRAQDINGAIKWLNVMADEGIKPLVYHINPIIATYARKGDITNTLYWFDTMQARYMVDPDMHTFSSMLIGYQAAGQPLKAIELFEAFNQRGTEQPEAMHRSPDLVMYNNAINCYAAANDLDGARMTFDKIKQVGGLQPSQREYTSLIFAYARHGDGDNAVKVFESMQKDGVSAGLHTMTSIITAWSKSGNIERATYWFNRMLEMGINPSNRTINSMMYTHAQSLDAAGARYYFNNMGTLYGLSPDVYSVNIVMRAMLMKVPAEYDNVIKMWTTHFMRGGGGGAAATATGTNAVATTAAAAAGGEEEGEVERGGALSSGGGVSPPPSTLSSPPLIPLLQPNHQSYSIMVAACKNNKKRASFWFGHMLRSGMEPDEKTLKLLRTTIGEKRFVEYCRNVAERDMENELDTEMW